MEAESTQPELGDAIHSRLKVRRDIELNLGQHMPSHLLGRTEVCYLPAHDAPCFFQHCRLVTE